MSSLIIYRNREPEFPDTILKFPVSISRGISISSWRPSAQPICQTLSIPQFGRSATTISDLRNRSKDSCRALKSQRNREEKVAPGARSISSFGIITFFRPTAAAVPRLPVPTGSKTATMPTEESLRLDDDDRVEQRRERAV